jgi:regulator of protease activity HflC (stomatin/prohibitin superfamily)
MIKVNKRLVGLILMVGIVGGSITGCKDYNTPEFVEVSPSQTAFMIPLVGDASSQVKMDSEEAVAKNLVNSKRVEIPKQWVQMGRTSFIFFENGKWMPTAKVIVVERKPETREWTEDGSGTSVTNQGIKAESKESIGFMARMNCTASIQEADAPKFLFNYNDKPLKDVMDTEIRANVESEFVKQCASKSMDEILAQKAIIMADVVKEVTDNFKAKGITVSQLGLKGDISYDNAETQKAIDSKFQAEKNQEAQAITNETNKTKATADAEVIKSQAATIKDSIELKKAEAMQTEAQAKLEMAKSMGGWKPTSVGQNPFTDFVGINGQNK